MRARRTPLARSAVVVLRHAAASASALGATVLAHQLAGGLLPSPCVTLPALFALASVVTGAASSCAHRIHGSWAALTVLALGQAGMMLALAVPTAGHLPIWTAWSALLHAAALPIAAALVLGLDRVAAGATLFLDRVAPQVRGGPSLAVARASGRLRRLASTSPAAVVMASCWGVRGPPLGALSH